MNNMAEANSDMKKFLELKKGNPETTQIKLLFE